MRHLGLTIAAAALAAALAGCGKSPSTTQSQNAQASSSEQPGAPSAGATAELTEDQKKALVATLPAPYSKGDIEDGEAKFAICKSCHTLAPGAPNMTGPNLYGVFDRKAASKTDFTYSDAMKAQTFAWDPQHLDAWLTDPKAMVPNTKMTFPGFKDPKDRIDVIAYLKAETSPPPKS